MTFRQALSEASKQLKSADILFCDTPLLDASVLLAFAAGLTREKLFASYPEELPEDAAKEFARLIRKRLSGLPVSYIRNRKEFYGREFYVDESVLVPRPDTEILIEKALMLLPDPVRAESANLSNHPAPLRLLDLCTGSGCIAATLKIERPDLSVTASDLSSSALKTAARNAANLKADMDLVESSLFERIEGRFDMIVTNPPYLTSEETIKMSDSGWPEPSMALDGGGDGLDLIRIIIESSLDYLNDNSYLLIEAGPEQAEKISKLLASAGFNNIEITPDMAGRNRLTSGRKSGTYNKEI